MMRGLCRHRRAEDTVRKLCRYGYCTEWRCTICGRVWMSAGPAGCKCDGYVRWLWHPDMDLKTPVPLKPQRRNQKKKPVRRALKGDAPGG